MFIITIIFIIILIRGSTCEPSPPDKSTTTTKPSTTTSTTTTTTIFNGRVNVVTDGSVYATCYDETNKILYIGGVFTYVGLYSGYGIPLNTSDGKPAVDIATMPKVNGTIRCAIPDGSGGWYIGGSFTQVGSTTRNRIARINSDGSVHSFNPNANDYVSALALSADGSTLYVGGAFTSIGGQTRNRIAAIDTATGQVRE